jgi:peptidoglycan/LPS O-acetylase OafA/YrhL
MGLLRFLLSICVVTSHCGSFFNFPMMTGDVAVQIFYIISGFYMSIILNEKYNVKRNSYKLFITNRLLRLYPVYIIVLLLTIVLFWVGSVKSNGLYHGKLDLYFQTDLSMSALLTLIFTNIFIVGQDILMFLGLNLESGNLFFTSNFHKHDPQLHTFLFIPQAWTLSVEIFFYAVAPFLITKGIRKVIIFILISLIIRFFIVYGLGFNNDPWGNRFFPNELLFFLLGYLSYYIQSNFNLRFKNPIYILVIFISLVFSILFYQSIPDFYLKYNPFGIKQTLFILFFTVALPILFNYTKNNRFDRFIGDLSYPIYISHMLIFMSIGMYGYKSSGLVIFVTIIFSIILNTTIINKFENYRQRRFVRSE